MKQYIPELQDISQWSVQPQYQTGGTRSKKVLKHPTTGDLYYFKTSLFRKGRDYKYEFWSEILASKIGKYLGFNLLDYNIAIHNHVIGCLSKSMIDNENLELIEGRQYLTGTDIKYNPDIRQSYGQYTFQFIEKALTEYQLKHLILEIIKTIIFDSIIGNSDRHQENWAIIGMKIENEDIRKRFNKRVSKFFTKLRLKFLLFLKKRTSMQSVEKIISTLKGKYSPIYDSGCCLGREILDSDIEKIMNDIEKYVGKGTAEIRWEQNDDKNKSISHFELISKIKAYKNEYKKLIESEIKRIVAIVKKDEIEQIINQVDIKLDVPYAPFLLPKERKELICKIIEIRLKKLKELL